MACARVPLDEQQVTEPGPLGKEHTLPALHPTRKEDRCFVPYKSLPEDGSAAEVEEFMEHAKFITEDLEWLLTLPHDKFWCQVVFDDSLQRCLDSYLHQAPRGLDLASLPSSPAVADMQRSVHRAVFLTFLRMATHKESKENFLTPAVFGEIIYENFLFDIPKILDLCVLFGKGNSQLLHKMLENIFTQQPSYYSDLDETVPTVLQVFDTILDKCGLHCEGATAMEPMKLSAHKQPTAMAMSQQDLVDLILYLCDSTTTIHAFLDIFPAACSSFHSHGFLSRLTSFYEAAVPDLEKAVRKRNFDDKGLQQDLWKRLSHSCRKIVEMAHLLLHHTCLQPILEGGENMQTFAEELLQHFTAFLPEKRFLSDYDEQFPIADDISLLQQALPVMYPYQFKTITICKQALTVLSVCYQGAVCPVSEGELESLLSCIRDLLPDLGEGFLLACLREYDYNSDWPLHVLDVRSNVFDDDEFDIFRRDQVDMSRIWKGRRKGESAREMLNDKKHVAEQRSRYQAYETVVDEVVIEPGESAEAYDYDDEYDDTYDMGQVGANDLDGDSLLNRRPFTIPQILRKGNKPELEEEGEDEEEEETLQVITSFKNSRSNITEKNSLTHFKRPNNVVGQAKGRGQTQETLVDRRKEANKGRGANHNRRNMADRKRNKGMIPS
uniref:Activating signal cointegrator 1 complex subunit 2 n=1 Tax=Sander lucioperca TaxID=283035 RepID=A0A8C9YXB5_SANLU